MLSVTEVMDALQEAGYINSWSKKQFDASWNGDGSLMETLIEFESDGDIIAVDNEVYYKKAMLYIHCADGTTTKRVAQLLRNLGGTPTIRIALRCR